MNTRRSLRGLLAIVPALPLVMALAACARPSAAQGSGWVNCTGPVGVTEWQMPGVSLVACRPNADEIVAASSHVGLYVSRDGGATWSRMGAPGQVNQVTYQIHFDPVDSRRMWVNGHYGQGIYRTTDGGASFEALGSMTHVDGLGIDFTDPNRRTMLLGMHEQGNKLYLSVTGGLTWRLITDNLPPLTGSTPNNAVLDDNTYLIQSTGGPLAGILRTTDGGRTWTRVCARSPDLNPLVTAKGAIFWMDRAGGLLRSTDRGATWIHLDAPANTCPIEANGMIVCAGTHRLYASKDSGATWAALGPPTPFRPVGVAYNSIRKAFYIWRMSTTRTASSIYRWKP